MSEDVEPGPAKSTPWMRRVIIYGAGLLIVFLLGFVPMWLKARTANSSLVEAEHQLSLVRMQNQLASAVIDARRGDYSQHARLSAVFKSLRAAIDRDTQLYQAQREGCSVLPGVRSSHAARAILLPQTGCPICMSHIARS